MSLDRHILTFPGKRTAGIPAAQIDYMAVKDQQGTVYAGPNSDADTAQLPTVEAYLRSYVTGRGKAFLGYLRERGLQPTIDYIGSHALPKDAVAAIASTGDSNVFLANRNFTGKLKEFAHTYARYGLSLEDAAEYVLHHEMAHAAGVQSEVAVETLLAEYFTHRAEELGKKGHNQQKYQRMAKLASDRVAQGEQGLRPKEPQYSQQAA